MFFLAMLGMRAFIAFEIPEEIRKKISEFQNELKKKDFLVGNWVKEYHMTLKFLGEISDDELAAVEEKLNEIAWDIKKFKLSLKGLSAFPSLNYVKVLWIRTDKGDKEAKKLQKYIDTDLGNLGFAKEKQYSNHLTICRVKAVKDKKELQKLFDNEINFGEFEVSEIKIIKSTLTEEGPVYEVLKEFKLHI